MTPRQTHQEWEHLIHNCTVSGPEVGSFSTANTRQGSECSISQERAKGVLEMAAEHNPIPAPLPEIVDTWVFVKRGDSGGTREGPALPLLTVIVIAVLF